MRFMVMAIHRTGSGSDRVDFRTREGSASAALDGAPSAEAVARLVEYNRSLQKAGVLLALDGLLPLSTGAHISYVDGKPMVAYGPFAESREVIGGYWIIQVRSREEAIEWAKRAPMSDNEIIEVRQIREMSDSPEDFRKAAEGFSLRTR